MCDVDTWAAIGFVAMVVLALLPPVIIALRGGFDAPSETQPV